MLSRKPEIFKIILEIFYPHTWVVNIHNLCYAALWYTHKNQDRVHAYITDMKQAIGLVYQYYLLRAVTKGTSMFDLPDQLYCPILLLSVLVVCLVDSFLALTRHHCCYIL